MDGLCGSWWLDYHLPLASFYVQDLDVEAGSLFGSCVEVLWDDGNDETFEDIAVERFD